MSKKPNTTLQVYNVDASTLELLDTAKNEELNLSTDSIMKLAELTGNSGWLGWALPQVSRSSRGTLLINLAVDVLNKIERGELSLDGNIKPVVTPTQANPSAQVNAANIMPSEPIKIQSESTDRVKTQPKIISATRSTLEVEKASPQPVNQRSYPIQQASTSQDLTKHKDVERKLNEDLKNEVLTAFN
ncbi:TPA: hypothetical protein ACX6RO_001758 [Photobacterium damselae]